MLTPNVGLTPRTTATVYSATWTNPASPTTDGPLYCGYFFDAEAGNDLARNRYYTAALATWMSRDPIGYKGGINLYKYVGDDPLTRTDPSGTKCRVAVRCGLVAYGHAHHCGLMVETDIGTFGVDGSGGNTSTIGWEKDPKPWGDTGNYTAFPNSVCACLVKETARWNSLKVPRTSFGHNSNWTLRCLTSKCGLQVTWKNNNAPIGWNSDGCADRDQKRP